MLNKRFKNNTYVSVFVKEIFAKLIYSKQIQGINRLPWYAKNKSQLNCII